MHRIRKRPLLVAAFVIIIHILFDARCFQLQYVAPSQSSGGGANQASACASARSALCR
jgi:hypothetical protein